MTDHPESDRLTLDDRLAEIERGMEKDGWHPDHREAVYRARQHITELERRLAAAERVCKAAQLYLANRNQWVPAGFEEAVAEWERGRNG